MELQEAVELIRPALSRVHAKELWADLGSGTGLFTLALATLLKQGSSIHAVDQRRQLISSGINGNVIQFHQLDFVTGILPFSKLDGILMANSFHFVPDKRKLLLKLKQHLNHNGQLIIVEYELLRANEWVPYPITYLSLKELLAGEGFTNIDTIGQRKSAYGSHQMYAATATMS